MGEQLYLEPWKSVLGRSILHYLHCSDNLKKSSKYRLLFLGLSNIWIDYENLQATILLTL